MADQELRDKTGKMLGRIKTLSDGKLEFEITWGILKVHLTPRLMKPEIVWATLSVKGIYW